MVVVILVLTGILLLRELYIHEQWQSSKIGDLSSRINELEKVNADNRISKPIEAENNHMSFYEKLCSGM